jgi:hypothetical protein
LGLDRSSGLISINDALRWTARDFAFALGAVTRSELEKYFHPGNIPKDALKPKLQKRAILFGMLMSSVRVHSNLLD